MIKIAVLGCGTVGSGVIKLLQQNGETIAMRAGEAVELKWALDLDKEKCRASGVEEGSITDQFDDILNDDEVDIVVELIGGIEPAFSYIIPPEQGQTCRHRQQRSHRRKGTGDICRGRSQSGGFLFRSQCGRGHSHHRPAETIPGR